MMAQSEASNDLTESDMAAAYHLMLLSEEDINNNIKGKRNRSFVEEEVGQILLKEIFWKEEVIATKKQRRYRSLEHIYMVTTPIINA